MVVEKQKFSDASIWKMLGSVPFIGLGGAMLGLMAKFYKPGNAEVTIGFGLISLALLVFGWIYGFTWGTRTFDFGHRRWMSKSRFGWKLGSGSFEEIRSVCLKKTVYTDLNRRSWITFDVGLVLKEDETVISIKSMRKFENSRKLAEDLARSIGVDLIDYTDPADVEDRAN